MRTTSTLLMVVMLIGVMAGTAVATDPVGPRLEGTITLRSGETISGLILTAQLGIVPGAEIGSRLQDGGYIAVKVNGDERNIQATDIAAIDAEWTKTGTDEDPKWKITKLTVTTHAGEVVTGTPGWLVHATSLIVEQADGTPKKVYAFPMAGANFSPDNLMTALTIGAGPPPTPAEEPPTPAEGTETTETAEPAPTGEAPAPEPTGEDVVTVEPETEGPAETTGPVPTVSVTAAPTIESLPAGEVFASGQPAIITFEVINPETGKPMQVRFLIVPLPIGQ